MQMYVNINLLNQFRNETQSILKHQDVRVNSNDCQRCYSLMAWHEMHLVNNLGLSQQVFNNWQQDYELWLLKSDKE